MKAPIRLSIARAVLYLYASTLRAKVIAGESKADQSSYLFSEEVRIGDFIGFSLEWEATDWILKGNFSTTHVENDNTATSTLSSAVAQLSPTDWPNNLEYAQELSLVNKDVRYASLGGTFFFSDWRLITEFSILHYQEPMNRVRQIKSILLSFSGVLLLLLLNELLFQTGDRFVPYIGALIVMIGLCSFVTSDTTSIVSGMLLWTLLLFACYMAWSNDGLFDTAIVAFPCILIFAFMLGGLSLMIPLVCFMIGSFYFMAYASDQGLLIKPSLVEGPLWVKANNLSIILLVYSLAIFIIYRYINSLFVRIQDESDKTRQFKLEAEKQLQQDVLTGLPNDLVCQKALQDILTNGQIKDQIVGVATLDLKNFEWVDSSLGHEIGDQVICLLSERLRVLMDDNKQLFRVTGNEFMILIIESDYEAISEFCHQVLQVVFRPFEIDSYEVEISACIGVATAPFDGTDYSTLRQKSHTALYKAKLDEEHHLKFFEADMEHSISRRVKVVQEPK